MNLRELKDRQIKEYYKKKILWDREHASRLSSDIYFVPPEPMPVDDTDERK